VPKRSNIDWPAAYAALRESQRLVEQAQVRAGERLRIQRERARLLAQKPAATVSARIEIVIFRVGPERFALPLSDVAEVVAHPAIAPVPGAPPEIAGVLQVRGEIRPVFALARLFGIEPAEADAVLLVRHNGSEAGLATGEVEDIAELREEDRAATAPEDPRIRQVTSGLIQVLGLEAVLRDFQIQQR
jgi:purine-binding chemotaxis protein CheW